MLYLWCLRSPSAWMGGWDGGDGIRARDIAVACKGVGRSAAVGNWWLGGMGLLSTFKHFL